MWSDIAVVKVCKRCIHAKGVPAAFGETGRPMTMQWSVVSLPRGGVWLALYVAFSRRLTIGPVCKVGVPGGDAEDGPSGPLRGTELAIVLNTPDEPAAEKG